MALYQSPSPWYSPESWSMPSGGEIGFGPILRLVVRERPLRMRFETIWLMLQGPLLNAFAMGSILKARSFVAIVR